MGRSDISFGSSEYLPSPVQTSPLPPWKISAWLVEGIPFTRGRHLPHQVPLPHTKIRHPRTRFVAKSSRKWPEVARKKEFNAITLLIRRDAAESQKVSCHSDKNVLNYEYDYVIENNGSLEELENKAYNFLKTIGDYVG